MVDLPVVVDWVSADTAGCDNLRIVATIDLVDATPQIVEMTFQAPTGSDPTALQRDFRWASPLEVVTGLMPALLDAGIDPFGVDLPLTGFPAVATRQRARQRNLSDEFLTTIAREYTLRGRGYAASLAKEYVVSPRTVVSWIEKARTRGLLTRPTTPGRRRADYPRALGTRSKASRIDQIRVGVLIGFPRGTCDLSGSLIQES